MSTQYSKFFVDDDDEDSGVGGQVTDDDADAERDLRYPELFDPPKRKRRLGFDDELEKGFVPRMGPKKRKKPRLGPAAVNKYVTAKTRAPVRKRPAKAPLPAPRKRKPSTPVPTTTPANAASRAATVKAAYVHLKRWRKMVANGKNTSANVTWLDKRIDMLEDRLAALYDDERRAIYGSSSRITGLNRKTSSLQHFWIPRVVAGIEQRNII